MDQNTLNTLTQAAIGREQEISHYQINIDNYTVMLASLPTDDWPAEIAPYQGADVSVLPHDMPEETVSLISDYQYRDRLRALLRTEKIEQNKVVRLLSALKAQIGADYEEVLLAQASLTLDVAKSIAMRKIDTDVDALYLAVVGNKQTEYLQAEQEAITYRDAGYSGVVPPMVQSWAVIKGWTAQQSAEDILRAASEWRQAQLTIRDNRLGSKEQIRIATTNLEVDSRLDAWNSFLAYMKTVLV